MDTSVEVDRDEAPEYRAHLAAVADPRARRGLSARGRVALPTPGRADEFPILVEGFAASDPAQTLPRAARALRAIRWKVGELLGWDGPDARGWLEGADASRAVAGDLRDAPSGPEFDALPFTSLYLLDDEFAAEIANQTMHGILHLGWVPDESGGYRGQMAVLVKPNGLLGTPTWQRSSRSGT